jgi:hypothetical protein
VTGEIDSTQPYRRSLISLLKAPLTGVRLRGAALFIVRFSLCERLL